jgi:hypothetical protein
VVGAGEELGALGVGEGLGSPEVSLVLVQAASPAVIPIMAVAAASFLTDTAPPIARARSSTAKAALPR